VAVLAAEECPVVPGSRFRARVCITDLPLEYVNEAIYKLGQVKRYSGSLAVGR